ncbi:MAG: ABC transporter ATP-binding protein [Erysipelotrichaceae bacterium]|nr:ABC transporter ATP-binding protein [Erysipelotrichaceae bacterium]
MRESFGSASTQQGTFPKTFQELIHLLTSFLSRFTYIVKLVWKTGHWILFLLTFVALFKGITPVLGSLLSQSILNELQGIIQQGALPEGSFYTSTVFYLLVFLFLYRIFLQIINHISRALNRIAGEQVVKHVKVMIMEKSKQLDLASFDDPTFYEKMENASREAGNRPLTILSETFNAISTMIELTSYLAILLMAKDLPLITFVIISVSIPTAIINFVYRKKNFQYIRNRSKERRQMNYYANLLVDKDLIKEVRMYDLADTFITRYLQAFQVYYKGLRKLITQENTWHILISILSGITNLIFYVTIAKQVYTGTIMIGDYTLFTGAIASVTTCINTLISTSGSIYEGTLFIDNLIDFLEEEQTVVPTTQTPSSVSRNIAHTLELRNVSFRYPNTTKDILKNISLVIEPGQTLALVGLNGAGKTTLIKLLTRLYDPTEGVILLDGKDIREYDLSSLYRTYGIIFQDFGKYAVSVEENIRFGNVHKEGTIEEVQEAAKQSNASEYIEKLPQSYQTPLMRIFEQSGTELSGGQWQKLAIARAFYADSDILILDEPTAALDPIAEQEIFNQFDALRKDKTTIFVSHRLSSAIMADSIIVLENGEMIEKGSHQELMAREGKYYELFSTQAKRYIPQAV